MQILTLTFALFYTSIYTLYLVNITSRKHIKMVLAFLSCWLSILPIIQHCPGLHAVHTLKGMMMVDVVEVTHLPELVVGEKSSWCFPLKQNQYLFHRQCTVTNVFGDTTLTLYSCELPVESDAHRGAWLHIV